MFCKNCGNELVPGKKFCGKCGIKAPTTFIEDYTGPESNKKKAGGGTAIVIAAVTLVGMLLITGVVFLVTQKDKLKKDTGGDVVCSLPADDGSTGDDGTGDDGTATKAGEGSGLIGRLFGGGSDDTPVETPIEEPPVEVPVDDGYTAVDDSSPYEDSVNEQNVLAQVRVNAIDGYANFRSTASNGDNIMGTISTGEILSVYDFSGDWLYVDFHDTRGYVHYTQVAYLETYDDGTIVKQLCPWSSTELIRTEDVVNVLKYNADNVFKINYPTIRTFPQMIINEIYARHGYIFQTPELQEYFERQPWYYGISGDMNDINNSMNQIELDNIKLLKNM